MVPHMQDMAGHHQGEVRLDMRGLRGCDTQVQVHQVRARVAPEVLHAAGALRVVRVGVLEQEEDEGHEGAQQEGKEGVIGWQR